MVFFRGLKPALDGVLNVLDGFEFGLAVRHAAREIRNSRKKATAILCGKRIDHDPVLRSLTHGSISKEAYELPNVYRFNGAFERYGQNLPFARLGDLEMRSTPAGWAKSRAKHVTNNLDLRNFPVSCRIPGHTIENVVLLFVFWHRR